MPVKSAVVLGAIAALSSTAVVLRVLVDRAEIDSVRGRNALGILLFQDIAVVPLVILVSVLRNGNSGGPFLPLLLKTLGSAAGIAIVFYLLFYRVFPLMMSAAGIFANRELFVLLTIAAAIGSIWAAHYLNLSPALGAFLAGMLLGESPYGTQIRADIGSIRTLFVTLFFTSVGMLADPRWFASHWPAVFLWLSVVLAI
ncbi:MAG: cation:proton antiporter [Desulfobacterales bacterium]